MRQVAMKAQIYLPGGFNRQDAGRLQAGHAGDYSVILKNGNR